MQRWMVIAVTFVVAYAVAVLHMSLLSTHVVTPSVTLSPVATSRAPLTTVTDPPKALPTIAVAILTREASHKTRLNAVMTSWGRDINVEIIATDSVNDQIAAKYRPKMLACPFRGTDALGSKAMYVWKKMCDKPASEFYMMTDDDTLLNVPVLTETMAYFDPLEDLYAGYVCTHLRIGPFVGGGAGIVLSRRTLKRFCDLDTTLPSSRPCTWDGVRQGAGDLATQDCLVNVLGVRPTHIEGFIPFTPAAYYDNTVCEAAWWLPAHMNCSTPPAQLIGMHYVPWTNMQPWYFLLTHARSTVQRPVTLRQFAPQAPAHRKHEADYLEMMRLWRETERKTKARKAQLQGSIDTRANETSGATPAASEDSIESNSRTAAAVHTLTEAVKTEARPEAPPES